MSKVAIKGANTGTGTFTIESPATNTDRTINLPDSNGTILTTATAGVPVNGPAFSASLAPSQSVSSNTTTKVQLTVEQFDTNSAFDNVTNYRFQPTVSGYYQFNYGVRSAGTPGTIQASNACLYKNGSEVIGQFTTGSFLYATAVNEANSTGAILVFLNGSTDYVELYGKAIGTSVYFSAAYMTGFLARSAT